MQTQTQLHTPYILDQDWVAAINEALTAPATVPFAIEPVCMAVYDLMFGRECDPTNYYRTVADCEQYLLGYMDGAKAWAAYVDEVNAQPRNGLLQRLIDYGAEAADLEDARLDIEFWRGGC